MGDIKNRLHIELSNFLEKSRASAEVVTTDEWDFESTTSANSITPASVKSRYYYSLLFKKKQGVLQNLLQIKFFSLTAD